MCKLDKNWKINEYVLSDWHSHIPFISSSFIFATKTTTNDNHYWPFQQSTMTEFTKFPSGSIFSFILIIKPSSFSCACGHLAWICISQLFLQILWPRVSVLAREMQEQSMYSHAGSFQKYRKTKTKHCLPSSPLLLHWMLELTVGRGWVFSVCPLDALSTIQLFCALGNWPLWTPMCPEFQWG